MPSELNFRANIFGLPLGVEAIIPASAVGSCAEEMRPRSGLSDQFIDRTFNRTRRFRQWPRRVCELCLIVLCDPLRWRDSAALSKPGACIARTYVCMEGPQFSTLAESNLYRSWGAHVIGMTNLQEAKLAREAEICYTTMALVTDYDCWHPDHDSVTVELIIQNLTHNAKTAQQVVAAAVAAYSGRQGCSCGSALSTALITRPDAIPGSVKRDLAPIIGKYIQ